MPKDSLAQGAQSAQFSGGQAKKDDPIEFHGTVATEEVLEEMHAAMDDKPATKALEHAIFIADCKPMNGRVLIRRVKEAEGTIVQPDQWKQQSPKGMVIAIPDRFDCVNVGDTVLFGEYNAEEVDLDGEKLLLVDSHDIRLKLPS